MRKFVSVNVDFQVYLSYSIVTLEFSESNNSLLLYKNVYKTKGNRPIKQVVNVFSLLLAIQSIVLLLGSKSILINKRNAPLSSLTLYYVNIKYNLCQMPFWDSTNSLRNPPLPFQRQIETGSDQLKFVPAENRLKPIF